MLRFKFTSKQKRNKAKILNPLIILIIIMISCSSLNANSGFNDSKTENSILPETPHTPRLIREEYSKLHPLIAEYNNSDTKLMTNPSFSNENNLDSNLHIFNESDNEYDKSNQKKHNSTDIKARNQNISSTANTGDSTITKRNLAESENFPRISRYSYPTIPKKALRELSLENTINTWIYIGSSLNTVTSKVSVFSQTSGIDLNFKNNYYLYLNSDVVFGNSLKSINLWININYIEYTHLIYLRPSRTIYYKISYDFLNHKVGKNTGTNTLGLDKSKDLMLLTQSESDNSDMFYIRTFSIYNRALSLDYIKFIASAGFKNGPSVHDFSPICFFDFKDFEMSGSNAYIHDQVSYLQLTISSSASDSLTLSYSPNISSTYNFCGFNSLGYLCSDESARVFDKSATSEAYIIETNILNSVITEFTLSVYMKFTKNSTVNFYLIRFGYNSSFNQYLVSLETSGDFLKDNKNSNEVNYKTYLDNSSWFHITIVYQSSPELKAIGYLNSKKFTLPSTNVNKYQTFSASETNPYYNNYDLAFLENCLGKLYLGPIKLLKIAIKSDSYINLLNQDIYDYGVDSLFYPYYLYYNDFFLYDKSKYFINSITNEYYERNMKTIYTGSSTDYCYEIDEDKYSRLEAVSTIQYCGNRKIYDVPNKWCILPKIPKLQDSSIYMTVNFQNDYNDHDNNSNNNNINNNNNDSSPLNSLNANYITYNFTLDFWIYIENLTSDNPRLIKLTSLKDKASYDYLTIDASGSGVLTAKINHLNTNTYTTNTSNNNKVKASYWNYICISLHDQLFSYEPKTSIEKTIFSLITTNSNPSDGGKVNKNDVAIDPKLSTLLIINSDTNKKNVYFKLASGNKGLYLNLLRFFNEGLNPDTQISKIIFKKIPDFWFQSLKANIYFDIRSKEGTELFLKNVVSYTTSGDNELSSATFDSPPKELALAGYSEYKTSIFDAAKSLSFDINSENVFAFKTATKEKINLNNHIDSGFTVNFWFSLRNYTTSTKSLSNILLKLEQGIAFFVEVNNTITLNTNSDFVSASLYMNVPSSYNYNLVSISKSDVRRDNGRYSGNSANITDNIELNYWMRIGFGADLVLNNSGLYIYNTLKQVNFQPYTANFDVNNSDKNNLYLSFPVTNMVFYKNISIVKEYKINDFFSTLFNPRPLSYFNYSNNSNKRLFNDKNDSTIINIDSFSIKTFFDDSFYTSNNLTNLSSSSIMNLSFEEYFALKREQTLLLNSNFGFTEYSTSDTTGNSWAFLYKENKVNCWSSFNLDSLKLCTEYFETSVSNSSQNIGTFSYLTFANNSKFSTNTSQDSFRSFEGYNWLLKMWIKLTNNDYTILINADSSGSNKYFDLAKNENNLKLSKYYNGDVEVTNIGIDNKNGDNNNIYNTWIVVGLYSLDKDTSGIINFYYELPYQKQSSNYSLSDSGQALRLDSNYKIQFGQAGSTTLIEFYLSSISLITNRLNKYNLEYSLSNIISIDKNISIKTGDYAFYYDFSKATISGSSFKFTDYDYENTETLSVSSDFNNLTLNTLYYNSWNFEDSRLPFYCNEGEYLIRLNDHSNNRFLCKASKGLTLGYDNSNNQNSSFYNSIDLVPKNKKYASESEDYTLGNCSSNNIDSCVSVYYGDLRSFSILIKFKFNFNPTVSNSKLMFLLSFQKFVVKCQFYSGQVTYRLYYWAIDTNSNNIIDDSELTQILSISYSTDNSITWNKLILINNYDSLYNQYGYLVVNNSSNYYYYKQNPELKESTFAKISDYYKSDIFLNHLGHTTTLDQATIDNYYTNKSSNNHLIVFSSDNITNGFSINITKIILFNRPIDLFEGETFINDFYFSYNSLINDYSCIMNYDFVKSLVSKSTDDADFISNLIFYPYDVASNFINNDIKINMLENYTTSESMTNFSEGRVRNTLLSSDDISNLYIPRSNRLYLEVSSSNNNYIVKSNKKNDFQSNEYTLEFWAWINGSVEIKGNGSVYNMLSLTISYSSLSLKSYYSSSSSNTLLSESFSSISSGYNYICISISKPLSKTLFGYNDVITNEKFVTNSAIESNNSYFVNINDNYLLKSSTGTNKVKLFRIWKRYLNENEMSKYRYSTILPNEDKLLLINFDLNYVFYKNYNTSTKINNYAMFPSTSITNFEPNKDSNFKYDKQTELSGLKNDIVDSTYPYDYCYFGYKRFYYDDVCFIDYNNNYITASKINQFIIQEFDYKNTDKTDPNPETGTQDNSFNLNLGPSYTISLWIKPDKDLTYFTEEKEIVTLNTSTTIQTHKLRLTKSPDYFKNPITNNNTYDFSFEFNCKLGTNESTDVYKTNLIFPNIDQASAMEFLDNWFFISISSNKYNTYKYIVINNNYKGFFTTSIQEDYQFKNILLFGSFRGSIREFYLYNQPLKPEYMINQQRFMTPDRKKQKYNYLDYLVLYLPFNEPQGQYVYDYSENRVKIESTIQPVISKTLGIYRTQTPNNSFDVYPKSYIVEYGYQYINWSEFNVENKSENENYNKISNILENSFSTYNYYNAYFNNKYLYTSTTNHLSKIKKRVVFCEQDYYYDTRTDSCVEKQKRGLVFTYVPSRPIEIPNINLMQLGNFYIKVEIKQLTKSITSDINLFKLTCSDNIKDLSSSTVQANIGLRRKYVNSNNSSSQVSLVLNYGISNSSSPSLSNYFSPEYWNRMILTKEASGLTSNIHDYYIKNNLNEDESKLTISNANSAWELKGDCVFSFLTDNSSSSEQKYSFRNLEIGNTVSKSIFSRQLMYMNDSYYRNYNPLLSFSLESYITYQDDVNTNKYVNIVLNNRDNYYYQISEVFSDNSVVIEYDFEDNYHLVDYEDTSCDYSNYTTTKNYSKCRSFIGRIIPNSGLTLKINTENNLSTGLKTSDFLTFECFIMLKYTPIEITVRKTILSQFSDFKLYISEERYVGSLVNVLEVETKSETTVNKIKAFKWQHIGFSVLKYKDLTSLLITYFENEKVSTAFAYPDAKIGYSKFDSLVLNLNKLETTSILYSYVRLWREPLSQGEFQSYRGRSLLNSQSIKFLFYFDFRYFIYKDKNNSDTSVRNFDGVVRLKDDNSNAFTSIGFTENYSFTNYPEYAYDSSFANLIDYEYCSSYEYQPFDYRYQQCHNPAIFFMRNSGQFIVNIPKDELWLELSKFTMDFWFSIDLNEYAENVGSSNLTKLLTTIPLQFNKDIEGITFYVDGKNKQYYLTIEFFGIQNLVSTENKKDHKQKIWTYFSFSLDSVTMKKQIIWDYSEFEETINETSLPSISCNGFNIGNNINNENTNNLVNKFYLKSFRIFNKAQPFRVMREIKHLKLEGRNYYRNLLYNYYFDEVFWKSEDTTTSTTTTNQDGEEEVVYTTSTNKVLRFYNRIASKRYTNDLDSNYQIFEFKFDKNREESNNYQLLDVESNFTEFSSNSNNSNILKPSDTYNPYCEKDQLVKYLVTPENYSYYIDPTNPSVRTQCFYDNTSTEVYGTRINSAFSFEFQASYSYTLEFWIFPITGTITTSNTNILNMTKNGSTYLVLNLTTTKMSLLNEVFDFSSKLQDGYSNFFINNAWNYIAIRSTYRSGLSVAANNYYFPDKEPSNLYSSSEYSDFNRSYTDTTYLETYTFDINFTTASVYWKYFKAFNKSNSFAELNKYRYSYPLREYYDRFYTYKVFLPFEGQQYPEILDYSLEDLTKKVALSQFFTADTSSSGTVVSRLLPRVDYQNRSDFSLCGGDMIMNHNINSCAFETDELYGNKIKLNAGELVLSKRNFGLLQTSVNWFFNAWIKIELDSNIDTDFIIFGQLVDRYNSYCMNNNLYDYLYNNNSLKNTYNKLTALYLKYNKSLSSVQLVAQVKKYPMFIHDSNYDKSNTTKEAEFDAATEDYHIVLISIGWYFKSYTHLVINFDNQKFTAYVNTVEINRNSDNYPYDFNNYSIVYNSSSLITRIQSEMISNNSYMKPNYFSSFNNHCEYLFGTIINKSNNSVVTKNDGLYAYFIDYIGIANRPFRTDFFQFILKNEITYNSPIFSRFLVFNTIENNTVFMTEKTTLNNENAANKFIFATSTDYINEIKLRPLTDDKYAVEYICKELESNDLSVDYSEQCYRYNVLNVYSSTNGINYNLNKSLVNEFTIEFSFKVFEDSNKTLMVIGDMSDPNNNDIYYIKITAQYKSSDTAKQNYLLSVSYQNLYSKTFSIKVGKWYNVYVRNSIVNFDDIRSTISLIDQTNYRQSKSSSIKNNTIDKKLVLGKTFDSTSVVTKSTYYYQIQYIKLWNVPLSDGMLEYYRNVFVTSHSTDLINSYFDFRLYFSRIRNEFTELNSDTVYALTDYTNLEYELTDDFQLCGDRSIFIGNSDDTDLTLNKYCKSRKDLFFINPSKVLILNTPSEMTTLTISEFTIEFWFMFYCNYDPSDDIPIVYSGSALESNNNQIKVFTSDSTMRVYLRTSPVNFDSTYNNVDNTVVMKEWNFFSFSIKDNSKTAFSFLNNSNKYKSFTNYVQRFDSFKITISPQIGTEFLIIGISQEGCSNLYLKSFRFWNKARNKNQVLQNQFNMVDGSNERFLIYNLMFEGGTNSVQNLVRQIDNENSYTSTVTDNYYLINALENEYDDPEWKDPLTSEEYKIYLELCDSNSSKSYNTELLSDNTTISQLQSNLISCKNHFLPNYVVGSHLVNMVFPFTNSVQELVFNKYGTTSVYVPTLNGDIQIEFFAFNHRDENNEQVFLKLINTNFGVTCVSIVLNSRKAIITVFNQIVTFNIFVEEKKWCFYAISISTTNSVVGFLFGDDVNNYQSVDLNSNPDFTKMYTFDLTNSANIVKSSFNLVFNPNMNVDYKNKPLYLNNFKVFSSIREAATSIKEARQRSDSDVKKVNTIISDQLILYLPLNTHGGAFDSSSFDIQIDNYLIVDDQTSVSEPGVYQGMFENVLARTSLSQMQDSTWNEKLILCQGDLVYDSDYKLCVLPDLGTSFTITPNTTSLPTMKLSLDSHRNEEYYITFWFRLNCVSCYQENFNVNLLEHFCTGLQWNISSYKSFEFKKVQPQTKFNSENIVDVDSQKIDFPAGNDLLWFYITIIRNSENFNFIYKTLTTASEYHTVDMLKDHYFSESCEMYFGRSLTSTSVKDKNYAYKMRYFIFGFDNLHKEAHHYFFNTSPGADDLRPTYYLKLTEISKDSDYIYTFDEASQSTIKLYSIVNKNLITFSYENTLRDLDVNVNYDLCQKNTFQYVNYELVSDESALESGIMTDECIQPNYYKMNLNTNSKIVNEAGNEVYYKAAFPFVFEITFKLYYVISELNVGLLQFYNSDLKFSVNTSNSILTINVSLSTQVSKLTFSMPANTVEYSLIFSCDYHPNNQFIVYFILNGTTHSTTFVFDKDLVINSTNQDTYFNLANTNSNSKTSIHIGYQYVRLWKRSLSQELLNHFLKKIIVNPTFKEDLTFYVDFRVHISFTYNFYFEAIERNKLGSVVFNKDLLIYNEKVECSDSAVTVSSSNNTIRCQYENIIQCENKKSGSNYYYFDYSSISCELCDSSCTNCIVTSKNCLSCGYGSYSVEYKEGYCYTGTSLEHFYLKSKQVATLSSTGASVTTFVKSYLECHVDCLNCSGPLSNNCLNCPSGSFIDSSNSCVSSCKTTEYLDESIGCVACASQCATCSGANDFCLKCADGNFFISENVCAESCPDETFLTKDSLGNDVCLACDKSCKSCETSANICLKCADNYYSYSNELSKCANVAETGYFINLTTELIEVCDSSCTKCEGSSTNCVGCPKYEINGLCYDACPSGYYEKKTGSEVYGICTACNEVCSTCIDDTKNCVECKSGYFYNSTSQECVAKCGSGYFESSTSASGCVACEFPCTECSESSTKCTSCNSSYALVTSTNTCVISCSSGYRKTQVTENGVTYNKCVACPEGCSSCSSSSTCTACISGYYYSSSKNTCSTTCESGTYKDSVNSSCIDCDKSCSTCTGSLSSDCITCASSYLLNINTELTENNTSSSSLTGSCVSSCTADTSFTYTDNSSSKFCYLCNSSSSYCKTCLNDGKGTSCTSCVSGYYLDSSNNQCISQLSIPQGYFGNSSNKLEPCHSNCKTCSGSASNQCLSCNENSDKSILINGTCNKKCDSYTELEITSDSNSSEYTCLNVANCLKKISLSNGSKYLSLNQQLQYSIDISITTSCSAQSDKIKDSIIIVSELTNKEDAKISYSSLDTKQSVISVVNNGIVFGLDTSTLTQEGYYNIINTIYVNTKASSSSEYSIEDNQRSIASYTNTVIIQNFDIEVKLEGNSDFTLKSTLLDATSKTTTSNYSYEVTYGNPIKIYLNNSYNEALKLNNISHSVKCSVICDSNFSKVCDDYNTKVSSGKYSSCEFYNTDYKALITTPTSFDGYTKNNDGMYIIDKIDLTITVTTNTDNITNTGTLSTATIDSFTKLISKVNISVNVLLDSSSLEINNITNSVLQSSLTSILASNSTALGGITDVSEITDINSIQDSAVKETVQKAQNKAIISMLDEIKSDNYNPYNTTSKSTLDAIKSYFSSSLEISTDQTIERYTASVTNSKGLNFTYYWIISESESNNDGSDSSSDSYIDISSTYANIFKSERNLDSIKVDISLLSKGSYYLVLEASLNSEDTANSIITINKKSTITINSAPVTGICEASETEVTSFGSITIKAKNWSTKSVLSYSLVFIEQYTTVISKGTLDTSFTVKNLPIGNSYYLRATDTSSKLYTDAYCDFKVVASSGSKIDFSSDPLMNSLFLTSETEVQNDVFKNLEKYDIEEIISLSRTILDTAIKKNLITVNSAFKSFYSDSSTGAKSTSSRLLKQENYGEYLNNNFNLNITNSTYTFRNNSNLYNYSRHLEDISNTDLSGKDVVKRLILIHEYVENYIYSESNKLSKEDKNNFNNALIVQSNILTRVSDIECSDMIDISNNIYTLVNNPYASDRNSEQQTYYDSVLDSASNLGVLMGSGTDTSNCNNVSYSIQKVNDSLDNLMKSGLSVGEKIKISKTNLQQTTELSNNYPNITSIENSAVASEPMQVVTKDLMDQNLFPITKTETSKPISQNGIGLNITSLTSQTQITKVQNTQVLSLPSQFNINNETVTVNNSPDDESTPFSNTACLVYDKSGVASASSCSTWFTDDKSEVECDCSDVGLVVNTFDEQLSKYNKILQFNFPESDISKYYKTNV